MTSHAHWFGAFSAAIAWTLASPGFAQTADKAVLHVRGTQPGMTYEMVPHRERAPSPRCSDPCEVVATPGKYDLRVFSGGEKLGSNQVTIARSADLRVSPPDVSASQGGLAMGIIGSAAFGGGLIALSIAALKQACEGLDCGGDQRSTIQLGLSALVVGAVLAPVGFVMFAKNRRPRVEILPPSGPARSASNSGDVTLRLGIRGGSLAAALTF